MKLNVKQAAQFLKLPKKTLERWIAQGFLPVQGSDEKPVFERKWLESWAKSKNLKISAPPESGRAPESEEKSLVQAMIRGGVFSRVQGESVDEVLVEAASLSPVPRELLADFTGQLLERERLCSTGQGKGVAIPHVRRPVEDEGLEASITTCFLKAPVDFKAIDGKPVSTLFLLISPSVEVHLHLLSRLAFCLRDDGFAKFLEQKPLPEDFMDRIRNLETKVGESGL